jgi:hypothetical protein
MPGALTVVAEGGAVLDRVAGSPSIHERRKPINGLQFVSTVRDRLGQTALTRPLRTSVS